MYESRTYEVDQQDAQSPGTVGDYLPTDYWHDAAGNLIKTAAANGLFQKYSYDGLGRQVDSYTCYDTGETAYADAGNVAGDTVIEQDQTWYDQAGEAVATATYQRLPDDTSTTGALDATDSYVTASATWYDGIGRQVATANYGREDVDSGATHYFFHPTGGSDAGGDYSAGDLIDANRDGVPDVAQAAPPQPYTAENQSSMAGIDFQLQLTEYDAAGLPYQTIDSLGRIDETLYDAAGRTVRTIQAFDGQPYGATGSGFASGGGLLETSTGQDVTVDYQYDSAGRLVTMTAYDAKGPGVPDHRGTQYEFH